MDPLSITTALVASLQVASSILSHCYSVRTEMRKMPGTLIQIIDEVRALRNLMETVESILDKNETSDQKGTSETPTDNIKRVIATCLTELQTVERRIRPVDVEAILGSTRKTLLQTLTWRLKGDEAKESILGLQRCKASLNLAITCHNSVKVENIERLSISLSAKMDESYGRLNELSTDVGTAQLNERQKAIVDWLSPLKPAHDHVLAQSSRQPGTSEWLQEGQDFQDWWKERNSILWITGPPGSGKTIMMSHAIQFVACHTPDHQDIPVCAFMYCNFRNPDSQDLVKVMGAILGQMCTQMKTFPQELQNSYRISTEQGWGQPPTLDMISNMIRVLSTKQRAFLFVDGMDEVGDPKALVEILVSLPDSSSWLNILLSSRNDVDIQRALSNVRRLSLEHHVLEIDRDIGRYVAKRLNNDRLPDDVHSLVSSSLSSKSAGSFQWAACQLDSLSHCRTIKDIKESLKRLPQGLGETYAKLLVPSSPMDVALVRKIMTWLAFSSIPLTLDQLWEALAIEKGQRVIDNESRLRSRQDILLLGSSLISASPNGHLALSHLSVRDYLVSSEIRNNPMTAPFALEASMSHRELAQVCLTYLLLSPLSSGPANTKQEYLDRLKHFPMLQYATKFWFYHARNAAADDELGDLIMSFFAPDARGNFMSWVQVLNADSPFKWNVYPKHATSLYYAASLGLDETVKRLLVSTSREEINAPGSRFGGTPTHAAAIWGHVSIIKHLAGAGADLGKADLNKVTPLHSAASRGRIETARVLLEYGAPREAKDGMDGKTPADWARLSGHEDVAEMIELFSEDADQDKEYEWISRGGIVSESPPERFADSIPHAIDVWQPGVCFFPDFYEKRSGMDCSRIVGITVGEESCAFDGDFCFRQGEGLDDGSAQQGGSGIDISVSSVTLNCDRRRS